MTCSLVPPTSTVALLTRALANCCQNHPFVESTKSYIYHITQIKKATTSGNLMLQKVWFGAGPTPRFVRCKVGPLIARFTSHGPQGKAGKSAFSMRTLPKVSVNYITVNHCTNDPINDAATVIDGLLTVKTTNLISIP